MKILNKINVFICFITFISCSAQSELKDNNKTLIKQFIEVDKNFVKIDVFLQKETNVMFNVLGDSTNYGVFVMNLLTNKEADIDVSHGVFVFGQPSSEPNYYLYLKNVDGTIEILNYKGDTEVDSLMSSFSHHFKRNKIESKEIKLKYLFGLVKFLNGQYTYPISINCLPYDWECEKE